MRVRRVRLGEHLLRRAGLIGLLRQRVLGNTSNSTRVTGVHPATRSTRTHAGDLGVPETPIYSVPRRPSETRGSVRTSLTSSSCRFPLDGIGWTGSRGMRPLFSPRFPCIALRASCEDQSVAP